MWRTVMGLLPGIAYFWQSLRITKLLEPKDVSACTVGNGQVGFLAIIAVIAGLEVAVFVQDPSKEPSNFGNPLPWWNDYSKEMRARELNNGRIAMFSAIGIIASGLYTGKPAIEQFGL